MREEVRRRLEELREETEADSLTEVIRRALAVYELLWRETRQHGELVIRRNGDEIRVALV
jgi:hypothetical protein